MKRYRDQIFPLDNLANYQQETYLYATIAKKAWTILQYYNTAAIRQYHNATIYYCAGLVVFLSYKYRMKEVKEALITYY